MPQNDNQNNRDLELESLFENWVMEASLKIRFNTCTYYVENSKIDVANSFLKKLGRSKMRDVKILHVVTNRVSALVGKDNILLDKYSKLFKREHDLNIVIHSVVNQDYLLRGINRKIKDMNLENE